MGGQVKLSKRDGKVEWEEGGYDRKVVVRDERSRFNLEGKVSVV